jgi:hypothetical protein
MSILLEGTQAMHVRPSDMDKMRVNTLGWWVVKIVIETENYFYESLLNVEIIWKSSVIYCPYNKG